MSLPEETESPRRKVSFHFMNRWRRVSIGVEELHQFLSNTFESPDDSTFRKHKGDF